MAAYRNDAPLPSLLLDMPAEAEEAERDWEAALKEYLAANKITLRKPTIMGTPLNLARLYREVVGRKGHKMVSYKRQWKDVGKTIGVTGGTSLSSVLKSTYEKYLRWVEERVHVFSASPEVEALAQERLARVLGGHEYWQAPPTHSHSHLLGGRSGCTPLGAGGGNTALTVAGLLSGGNNHNNPLGHHHHRQQQLPRGFGGGAYGASQGGGGGGGWSDSQQAYAPRQPPGQAHNGYGGLHAPPMMQAKDERQTTVQALLQHVLSASRGGGGGDVGPQLAPPAPPLLPVQQHVPLQQVRNDPLQALQQALANDPRLHGVVSSIIANGSARQGPDPTAQLSGGMPGVQQQQQVPDGGGCSGQGGLPPLGQLLGLLTANGGGGGYVGDGNATDSGLKRKREEEEVGLGGMGGGGGQGGDHLTEAAARPGDHRLEHLPSSATLNQLVAQQQQQQQPVVPQLLAVSGGEVSEDDEAYVFSLVPRYPDLPTVSSCTAPELALALQTQWDAVHGPGELRALPGVSADAASGGRARVGAGSGPGQVATVDVVAASLQVATELVTAPVSEQVLLLKDGRKVHCRPLVPPGSLSLAAHLSAVAPITAAITVECCSLRGKGVAKALDAANDAAGGTLFEAVRSWSRVTGNRFVVELMPVPEGDQRPDEQSDLVWSDLTWAAVSKESGMEALHSLRVRWPAWMCAQLAHRQRHGQQAQQQQVEAQQQQGGTPQLPRAGDQQQQQHLPGSSTAATSADDVLIQGDAALTVADRLLGTGGGLANNQLGGGGGGANHDHHHHTPPQPQSHSPSGPGGSSAHKQYVHSSPSHHHHHHSAPPPPPPVLPHHQHQQQGRHTPPPSEASVVQQLLAGGLAGAAGVDTGAGALLGQLQSLVNEGLVSEGAAAGNGNSGVGYAPMGETGDASMFIDM